MMRRFRDLPLKGKLMTIILGTSTAVMLISLLTFTSYGVWTNWQHSMKDIATLARVTALNTSAALTFNDARDASETLAALGADPSVIAAYILTDDHRVFAQFRSPQWHARAASSRTRAISDLIREAASVSIWRLGSDLVVAEPIMLDDQRLGLVLIQADGHALSEKIYWSVIITLAVAAVIFLIVFGVSSRLQRIISGPIVRLSSAMRGITESRSYQVRMDKQGRDEIGALYDGFNDMLEAIDDRTRKLQESEERFRALVESTNDWIWEIDANGRYTYASPRVRDLLGFEPREVIGRTPFDLMPPEEGRRVAAAFGASARTHAPLNGVENINLHKDGRLVVLETSGVPTFDAEGRFTGYRGIDRDITQRKEVEKKVGELMKEQQAILDASAVGVSFVKSRRQIWTNPAFTTIFGYSRSEAEGLDARRLYADVRDYERIGAEGYASLARGETYSADVIGRRKDGSSFWLHLVGRAVDPKDLTAGVIWVFQDITDRKHAEDALRESEEKYRLLVEAANSVILTWDTEGRILFLNEYGERFFGYTKNELVGRSVIGTIVPERESSGRDLKQLMKEIERDPDRYRDNENENIKRDGRRVWVRWANKAILDGEGTLTGILSVGNDITARRTAETELREKTALLEDLTRNLEDRVQTEISLRYRSEQTLIQQSKLASMGEMLGAIAHQWRQPLNALALIVQNLRDAYSFGDLDRDYIERAVQKSMAQIQHMSATIEDFRNFYRPDKERTVFDAMRAVGDVLSLFSGQLASNGISYRLTCHTHGRVFEDHANIVLCPEKAVDGFRNEFEHVVLNIINNARDAILARRERGIPAGQEGKGHLTFDFSQESGTIIVHIGDDGGGIPEDILGRIFEPYFTTKDPAKGTGLGLYMCKVIIEDHMGGKLSARNGDRGAVFTIELPQAGGGTPHA